MARKRKRLIGNVDSVFIINLKWNCMVITVVIIDNFTAIYTDCNGRDITKFQLFKGIK
jgi:hypothetical protein